MPQVVDKSEQQVQFAYLKYSAVPMLIITIMTSSVLNLKLNSEGRNQSGPPNEKANAGYANGYQPHTRTTPCSNKGKPRRYVKCKEDMNKHPM